MSSISLKSMPKLCVPDYEGIDKQKYNNQVSIKTDLFLWMINTLGIQLYRSTDCIIEDNINSYYFCCE